MIIGFTGTRQIDKISKERLKLLNTWVQMFILSQNYTFVHGGAIGTDELFHNIIAYSQENIGATVDRDMSKKYIPFIKVRFGGTNIRELRGKYEIVPPEPSYLTRNKKIADECDILIALPIDKDAEELRSSTWATIRYARKENKKIIII